MSRVPASVLQMTACVRARPCVLSVCVCVRGRIACLHIIGEVVLSFRGVPAHCIRTTERIVRICEMWRDAHGQFWIRGRYFYTIAEFEQELRWHHKRTDVLIRDIEGVSRLELVLSDNIAEFHAEQLRGQCLVRCSLDIEHLRDYCLTKRELPHYFYRFIYLSETHETRNLHLYF
eukprot:TRINITY_DN3536_c0_g1_i2.p2 TRINITY_DN3536_c0_g1~~TRINITY_DN3536_c0_g1_i2.p2  ORF type:complete len:175 (-),score=29.94 TRINITY_DN3536_c0_g1_i2:174-698(-)